jgi:hypothetical protein
MAKPKTPPPQQPQGKKTSKEQKPEKLFETGDGAAARITPRLRTHYEQVVRPQLQQQFNYTNPMQIPRLTKIVINMGVGKGEQEPKQLENAVRDLALISGQKPVVTVAKQAISNFRLRQGHRIGCISSWRSSSMWCCRAFATSRASRPARSTGAGTTRWDCASRFCSPKSSTIR